MNKKKVMYAVFIGGFIGLLFLGGRGATLQNTTLSLPDEQMVAPAIIDAVSDITRIPTLQSGIIQTMNVLVGQKVKQGDPLFSLENTVVENQYQVQKIGLEKAQNECFIQEQQVRHMKSQLARLRRVDKRAISRAELQEKMHEVAMGEAQWTQSKHQWALAKAHLAKAEWTRSQFTVRAPRDGIVLQINAHVHEFVSNTQPIVFLGDIKKIMVRVSLDERDIQQFDPKASAFLMQNGGVTTKIPLTFLQLNQYIVTEERLHSRVQEALYYCNRDDYPHLVAGQQLDATISVRPKA